MAIVAIAILISFHLKHDATALEKRVALPFGLVFWLLALACLGSGVGNYVKTVSRYSRRQALVQTGWGTQVVSFCFISNLYFTCYTFLFLYLGSRSLFDT